jgi:acyl carrier protein
MRAAEEVRRFLIQRLHLGPEASELTDDYPILERGLLDSSTLLELVDHIEHTCGVEIDEEDLVPEHFGSIGEIEALVTSKQAA